MKKFYVVLFISLCIPLPILAVTFTSTGNGNWLAPVSWAPAGPPSNGASTASLNSIIIQAGHTITIPGNTITLAHVVIEVYGTLVMKNGTGGSFLNYANLNLSGANSGVIIHPGGRVNEDVLLARNLNIRLDGTVLWNGSDGNAVAGAGTIYLPTPLPLDLVSWSVNVQGDTRIAQWTTANEFNNAYFTIEESINGLDFFDIKRVASKGSSQGQQNYSADFIGSKEPHSYYRLKQTDDDGTSTYSSIISLSSEKPKRSFSVFPNPVTSYEFNLLANENSVVSYTLKNTQTGQAIVQQNLLENHPSQTLITLPSSIPSGLYLLIIHHQEGMSFIPVAVFP